MDFFLKEVDFFERESYFSMKEIDFSLKEVKEVFKKGLQKRFPKRYNTSALLEVIIKFVCTKGLQKNLQNFCN